MKECSVLENPQRKMQSAGIKKQRKRGLSIQRHNRKVRIQARFYEKHKSLIIFSKISMFLCVTLIAYYCFLFISLNTEISSTKRAIAFLENKCEALKSQNEAIEYKLTGYTDKNQIIQIAINELDMCYPNLKDQIIYYDNTIPEYMHQYADIPH